MYVLELGGEDDAFAAAEAAAAANGVHIVAPGIAIASKVDRDRFAVLAYSHRASELVARAAGTVDASVRALETAEIGRSGSIAVRARDVRGTSGADTQRAERRLGQSLVDRGFAVDLDDPDHVLVALFAGDAAFLGWEVARSEREYGDRAPTDRPFFQPGSMDPLLARAVVNLAGVEPGDVVLDPMCGTGGLLIEAGIVGGRTLGFDAQRKMVAGARRNLEAFLETAPALGLADATALPLRDGCVDAVVFDAPYGRQSKIETHSLEDLVAGALADARRVGDRAVVVADREYVTIAERAGWTVTAVYERRVHRSLTRYVHILE